MSKRVYIGDKKDLETPVYVDGVLSGLIVLNPSGNQFMPTGSRAYLDKEDLVYIANLLGK